MRAALPTAPPLPSPSHPWLLLGALALTLDRSLVPSVPRPLFPVLLALLQVEHHQVGHRQLQVGRV